MLSKNKNDLSNLDLVILAGGLGTRLRPIVSDRPKVLAEVNGKPFLDILISSLSSLGFSKIILSVGHLKNQIKDRYSNQGIFFAEEAVPLGTGGGVKNSEHLVSSDHFVVMNGDSWFKNGVDFASIHDFHLKNEALVTMLLADPRKEKDYGAVFLDGSNRISRFNEKKEHTEKHFLNAGVYIMKKNVFSLMPSGNFSLESDFLPQLVGKNFYGFPVDDQVVDIGTPDRYKLANEVFKSKA